MIPDPTNANIAIDPDTGKLAGRVLITKVADPHAPTIAELNAATPVGWASDINIHFNTPE